MSKHLGTVGRKNSLPCGEATNKQEKMQATGERGRALLACDFEIYKQDKIR